MGSGSLGSLPAVGGSVSPPSLLFDLKCPPALEPAGCSVGPGLGAKMSASRRAHADECPSPHMSATSVHVTRVSHSHSLPPAWRLKDQQVGLAQAPVKLLLFPLVPAHTRFCMQPLRVKSLFSQSYRAPVIKPCRPFNPNALSTPIPSARSPG